MQKTPNILRNQKGFTLIEMLITLVVLGMIIGLVVGLFSNPVKDATLKQAALKIADDLRSVDDMAQKYTVDKGSNIAALTDLTDNAYLKAIPLPPGTALSVDGTVYAIDDATYTTTWGTAAADTVISLTNVKKDVCSKINATYLGMAEGANPPAAVTDGKDIQCFGAGPYTVLKPIYVQ